MTAEETAARATRWSGYRSFSYLEAGRDVPDRVLAAERNRVPTATISLTTEQEARAERLLQNDIVVSLHDHPFLFPHDPSELRTYMAEGRAHTGYEGLAGSGMTAVFDNLMDGMTSTGWKWDGVVSDIGMRLADFAHQDFVRVAHTTADIRAAHLNGQLAVVLGLETATPIQDELDRIDILYGFGIRQLGIAYSESNNLGSGLKEAVDGGLTVFGRRAVERMNKVGVAIDVSHSGDRTALDVFDHSTKPVLITHAGARSIWDTPRMKPDDVIRACAQTGGVIGIEAAPHTTMSAAHPRHDIDAVMDHFLYCVDLVGIEHVAFGPDTFFGDHVAMHDTYAPILGGVTRVPDSQRVPYVAGLENPGENFRNIFRWLVGRGFSDTDIIAVTGGNIMRTLEQIW